MPRRRPQQELEPGERWAGWHESLRARDQAREEEIDTQANRASERLNPLRFRRDIDAALPDNGVLVADGGDFVATALHHEPEGTAYLARSGAFRHPRRWRRFRPGRQAVPSRRRSLVAIR